MTGWNWISAIISLNLSKFYAMCQLHGPHGNHIDVIFVVIGRPLCVTFNLSLALNWRWFEVWQSTFFLVALHVSLLLRGKSHFHVYFMRFSTTNNNFAFNLTWCGKEKDKHRHREQWTDEKWTHIERIERKIEKRDRRKMMWEKVGEKYRRWNEKWREERNICTAICNEWQRHKAAMIVQNRN